MNERDLWKINTEIEFGGRGFIKEYSFVESRYEFLTYSINGLAAYSLTDRIDIATGIGVVYYQSLFSENHYGGDLGKGVRHWDMLIIAGTTYNLWNWMSVGMRFNYGIIPMFKGRVVLDYGEFSAKNNHVNLCAGQVVLRLTLFQNER